MKITKATLEGVLLISNYIFEDHRGQYVEIYNEKAYQEAFWEPIRFVEDDISVSTRHVLRGIHSDSEAWKLISCLHGKFYLVIVDCDSESNSFGKWESFVLSESSGLQVLVPPKHGIAHLVLSDKAIFHYKQSAYYDRSRQSTYRFDDARFGIFWPVTHPILSRRDKEGKWID